MYLRNQASREVLRMDIKRNTVRLYRSREKNTQEYCPTDNPLATKGKSYYKRGRHSKKTHGMVWGGGGETKYSGQPTMETGEGLHTRMSSGTLRTSTGVSKSERTINSGPRTGKDPQRFPVLLQQYRPKFSILVLSLL